MHLFVQITQLQYRLKNRRPVCALDSYEDWTHLLCHSGKLLGYRLIINFLVPSLERHPLLKLLYLLKRKAGFAEHSELTSEDMA